MLAPPSTMQFVSSIASLVRCIQGAFVVTTKRLSRSHLTLSILQLMAAQQRAYQAERASTTAVGNATQLQVEVLRLSNQMDAMREASEAQNSVVEAQQVRKLQCALTST